MTFYDNWLYQLAEQAYAGTEIDDEVYAEEQEIVERYEKYFATFSEREKNILSSYSYYLPITYDQEIPELTEEECEHVDAKFADGMHKLFYDSELQILENKKLVYDLI